MKLKFVKKKRKPLNNRFLSAVFGFAFAFAPVPYMISSASVSVSAADVPNEVQAFIDTLGDFVTDSSSVAQEYPDTYEFWYPLAYVQAFIDRVEWAYSSDSEIDISGSQLMSFYRTSSGGTIKNSIIYLSNQDSAVICRSPDFVISYNISSVSGHTVSNSVNNNQYTVLASTNTSGAYCSLSARDTLGFFTSTYSSSGNDVSFTCYTDLAQIPVLYSRRITSSNLVGGFPADIPFPSGSISKASPWEYYNNTLVPYLQTEYPNTPTPLMPEPYDEPYTPTYPTDFVTGIPKEWTVENPQLPTAVDLEFEHYEEDLTGFHPIQEIKETVDIIKAMDFWWWLTEKTLDSLNLKIFYVIFLTVGVLIFIVWIIGQ